VADGRMALILTE